MQPLKVEYINEKPTAVMSSQLSHHFDEIRDGDILTILGLSTIGNEWVIDVHMDRLGLDFPLSLGFLHTLCPIKEKQ